MGRTELVDALRAIEETLAGGILGVAAVYLPTGERIVYNGDSVFPTASTIKAVIIGELLTRFAEGILSHESLYSTPVTIHAEDHVGGSGVLAQLTPGLALSLHDLATLAIKVSDNTASNLVLRAVGGPEAVNRRMHSDWGMPGTTIHRPIKFHLEASDPPHTATGTPVDMCRFMEWVARRQRIDPAVSEGVERYLSLVSDADMLPRYLPVNFYATDLENEPPPFAVSHKPGAVTGVRNDAGIIRRGADAMAVCVYTRDCPDRAWTPANRGSEAVARVGELLTRTFFH